MPNSSFQKIKLLTLLVLFGLLASPAVLALELEYPSWFPIRGGMGLAELVLTLFNIFLIIAGAAAFIILVVAGTRYLASTGNPSVMADAKSQAFSAILGLALLLSSYLILTTINPQLVELKEPVFIPIGKAVYAPPGKIAVAVEKPKEEEKELDIGSGEQKIKLQESLTLVIDTNTDGTDADPVEIWLEVKKDASAGGGTLKLLSENLKVKTENTVQFDEIIVVPAEAEGFDQDTAVSVKFIISVGRTFVNKLVVHWKIEYVAGKSEGRETIDISSWEKDWNLVKLRIVTTLPTAGSPKLKAVGTLTLGNCSIYLCKDWDETLELDMNREEKLFDKSYEKSANVPILGDVTVKVGAVIKIKWIQQ